MASKIVIGHGRSKEWLVLEKFLKDDLGLDPEEYNSIATAGMGRQERLQQLRESATMAFLVATAEDEQRDGTARARENVVHEIGFFQGALGFRRAIVMLEEGCTEFSNIQGLDQIRFHRGDISTAFEQVRRVLRREGLI